MPPTISSYLVFPNLHQGILGMAVEVAATGIVHSPLSHPAAQWRLRPLSVWRCYKLPSPPSSCCLPKPRCLRRCGRLHLIIILHAIFIPSRLPPPRWKSHRPLLGCSMRSGCCLLLRTGKFESCRKLNMQLIWLQWIMGTSNSN